VPISNEITETYITVIANSHPSHPGKKEMEVNQNRKVDRKNLKAGNNEQNIHSTSQLHFATSSLFTLPEHLFLHETSGIIIFASISFNGLEKHRFVTRQGRSIKHKNKLKRKYYQLFLDIVYSICSL